MPSRGGAAAAACALAGAGAAAYYCYLSPPPALAALRARLAALLPTAAQPPQDEAEIRRGPLTVRVHPFGAALRSVVWTDQATGEQTDLVLGFEASELERRASSPSSPYFGCVVGRCANRIAGGSFELGGRRHTLARNDGGGARPNCLHGGAKGWDRRPWRVSHLSATSVTLTLRSAAGEEGFPGAVDASVTYSLLSEGDEMSYGGEVSLMMRFEATSDAETPVNMANHAYWNLAGHDSGEPVTDLELRVAANYYTPVDDDLIPTGEVAPVACTPMDFTVPRRIGEGAAAVPGGNGYDHSFCLAGPGASRGSADEPHPPRLAASVRHRRSGMCMDVLTDTPAVQVYTGGFLDGSLEGTKGGAKYGRFAGLCLETQGYPNAINTPSFPSVVIGPGDRYRHTTVHRFYRREPGK